MVLELLIKKKTNIYDVIFKIFENTNVSVLQEKHSLLLKEYCELIARFRQLTAEELKPCETENLEVLIKNKKSCLIGLLNITMKIQINSFLLKKISLTKYFNYSIVIKKL